LKLLPSSNGAYTVQPAGVTNVDDAVIFIAPLNADTGLPASASQEAVASLRDGGRINGVILAVHTTGARIFKPATAKGASRIWEGAYCDSAGVCRDSDSGAIGLVGLFGDGTFKSFSIPNLKEISSQRMDKVVATRRLSEGVVTPSGDCFVWIGPSELAVVNPWGAGVDSTASVDKLYNLNAVIPPRPTISNLAWISGTQYVTPADLDVLIGGPDRPPSKRMLEQMRADGTGKQPGPSDAVAAGQQPQGWGEYMSGMASSIQQRTENLNILGDSMDTLEKNSANFSNDVSKYVKDQKKKAVMGCESLFTSGDGDGIVLTGCSYWKQIRPVKRVTAVWLWIYLQRSRLVHLTSTFEGSWSRARKARWCIRWHAGAYNVQIDCVYISRSFRNAEHGT